MDNEQTPALFSSSDIKEWGWLEWLIIVGSMVVLFAALIGTIVALARSNSRLKSRMKNYAVELQVLQQNQGRNYFPSVASAQTRPRGEYGNVEQVLAEAKKGTEYSSMPASDDYGLIPSETQSPSGNAGGQNQYGRVPTRQGSGQYGSIPVGTQNRAATAGYGSVEGIFKSD